MTQLSGDLAREVRRALLALATAEEQTAMTEAAAVSYWQPYPSSVEGHRAAARALRAEADGYASFA